MRNLLLPSYFASMKGIKRQCNPNCGFVNKHNQRKLLSGIYRTQRKLLSGVKLTKITLGVT